MNMAFQRPLILISKDSIFSMMISLLSDNSEIFHMFPNISTNYIQSARNKNMTEKANPSPWFFSVIHRYSDAVIRGSPNFFNCFLNLWMVGLSANNRITRTPAPSFSSSSSSSALSTSPRRDEHRWHPSIPRCGCRCSCVCCTVIQILF